MTDERRAKVDYKVTNPEYLDGAECGSGMDVWCDKPSPTGEQVVALYHCALGQALKAIARDGIRPADSTHRDSLEADLAEVTAEKEIPFPIDRRQCVFLYPSLELAVEDMCPRESLRFRDSTVVVVIDATKVEGPLYIGDFRLISDAIDFQYLEEPDDVMVSESYEDALTRYATSLTEISSLDRIKALSNQYSRPEIVVEGGISPTCIIEYLSLKNIEISGGVSI